MEKHDPLFSMGSRLNEQICRQLFQILPEQGPVMIIMDREGNCWPSDSDAFSKLDINEAFLREVCSKIDDGDEPVVTGVNQCSVIATQIATERTNCGYVVIALPKHSPEFAMVNVDLIETLLNLVGLLATLIEKNNLLYELQTKSHFHAQGQIYSEAVLN